ncbi:MAG: utilization substance protein [Actinomycetota bacterium]
MSARSKARKRALDFLYEAEIKKVKAVDLFKSRGASELSQEPYVFTLLTGVAEHLLKIDELITTYAQDWDMDRMPAIDRNILRIAIYEILWVEEIDLKIACDEAVELAKSLSTDESSNYINGVLGRIVKLKDSIAI